jgi:hypothetical protein
MTAGRGDHSDLWNRVAALEELTSVYGETLDSLRNRVYALEHGTPQARQAQYEADEALADNAAAGYREDW